MTTDRKYSITLLGATGFTGGLCAHYLARHLPADTCWAIAGRNPAKLADLREALARAGATCMPEEIVADIHDAHSLADMAAVSRLVITTVGPYVLYGEGVIRACAEQGTHYCDLTGEPEFANNALCHYHELARQNDCALVNACGFDSIPYDAGVLYTIRELERLGGPLQERVEVTGVARFNAAFSGGTWQSAVTAFSRPRQNREAMKRGQMMLKHQYPRRTGSLSLRPRHDADFGCWLAPMPTIDPQVVSRSARALDAYGPDFHYGHYAGVSTLPGLIAGATGAGSLLLAAQVPPLRKLLLNGRRSGEGPPPEKRSRSWFKATFRGRTGGHTVMTEVSGGDPGYDETARMLSETAMGMALDPGMPRRTGVITPVMALEDRLIERLSTSGLGFRVLARH
jgi:short subunit dehydrogenase-like uncharacterized protein